MIKKIICYCSFLLCFVFISSAVSAREKPDWIESEPTRYPNNLYITAIGSASDLELAKDRALANLSKVFEVRIDQASTAKTDVYVSLHNMKEAVSKKNRLSQLIRVSTDKIIQGSQIVESWRDDELALYHSLAVLDRKQARNNIKDEMNRLDDETNVELENIKRTDDALLIIAGLGRAISLQQNRLSLHNVLKIINLHGRGYPGEWQLSSLQSQLEDKLRSLKITAVVDDVMTDKLSSKELNKLLKTSMAKSGFPAVDDGDYTFTINLIVNDLGFQQGWYWKRGRLTVELARSSGQIVEQKEWPLKVSALQREDAQNRLMTQVSKKLNTDLKSLIVSSVYMNN